MRKPLCNHRVSLKVTGGMEGEVVVHMKPIEVTISTGKTSALALSQSKAPELFLPPWRDCDSIIQAAGCSLNHSRPSDVSQGLQRVKLTY